MLSKGKEGNSAINRFMKDLKLFNTEIINESDHSLIMFNIEIDPKTGSKLVTIGSPVRIYNSL